MPSKRNASNEIGALALRAPDIGYVLRAVLSGSAVALTLGCRESGARIIEYEELVLVARSDLAPFAETGHVEGPECAELCDQEVRSTVSCEVNFDPALASGQSGVGGEGGGAGAHGENFVEILCELKVDSSSTVAGRRHACWGPKRRRPIRDAAAWCENATASEAGSVLSFRALARELAQHGFSGEWRARLRRAAREEIAHARMIRALGTRWGARHPEQHFSKVTSRTLLDVARENAREGCVRETYAALEMSHQAENAGDEELRATFAKIAEDECGHAQLAWDLHFEFLRRLSEEDRGELQATLDTSIKMLASAPFRSELTTGDLAALGLPDNQVAKRLQQNLAAALTPSRG